MIEYPYHHQSGKLPSSLASVQFLTTVSNDCLDDVLKHTTIIECSPGDVIIEEGQDGGKYFFILVKGLVQIVKSDEEIGRIGNPGELIGEQALLKGASGDSGSTERTATVKALEHTFCIKVNPSYLDELSDGDRQAYYAVLYRFIATLLADRLSQANQRIAELEKRLSVS
tara:strand:- start:7180 stop:7689 length:510 start_codon:yes stop_codon:yes gene_type:complete